MGIPSGKHHHARHRDGQDCRYDRRKAQARLRRAGSGKPATRLIGLLCALTLAFATFGTTTHADSIRVATFNAELYRKGPGLLLRDIQRGDDPQIAAIITLLGEIKPDVIALQGVDHDLRNTALKALIDALDQSGLRLPHFYASAPNAGQASGLDLNGNGRLGDADDAYGFGRYNGMGGMAVLSRDPILYPEVEDFTQLLWRDLPDNLYPGGATRPFGGHAVYGSHRLSSRGHWVVPVATAQHGVLRLLTFHATPPVYDGAEDRNGRRNHDEVEFWTQYLTRNTDLSAFVLAGTANTDPERGSGRPEAITTLLKSPALQNPFDDAPTADFDDPVPGDLRVDYLLPSADWTVVGHGTAFDPIASRHTLLWVDLEPADP